MARPKTITIFANKNTFVKGMCDKITGMVCLSARDGIKINVLKGMPKRVEFRVQASFWDYNIFRTRIEELEIFTGNWDLVLRDFVPVVILKNTTAQEGFLRIMKLYEINL